MVLFLSSLLYPSSHRLVIDTPVLFFSCLSLLFLYFVRNLVSCYRSHCFQRSDFFAAKNTTLASHANLRSGLCYGIKWFVHVPLRFCRQQVKSPELIAIVGYHCNRTWTTIMAATDRHQNLVAVGRLLEWRTVADGTCGRLLPGLSNLFTTDKGNNMGENVQSIKSKIILLLNMGIKLIFIIYL